MDQDQHVAILSQVEVFRGLPPAALQRLAKRAEVRSFSRGAALMRQGDVSESMYIITQGRVRVERSDPLLKGPLVFAELNAGDIVGELALLDGEPRSATVTAIEPTTTLELSAPALAMTLLQHPEMSRALLTVLSQRLRSTDQLAVRMLRMQLHKQWKPVAP